MSQPDTINYLQYWDNLKVGEIPWVRRKKSHPVRDRFVRYCINTMPASIIEIGAGECIEADEIRKVMPKIRYEIVDIATPFIECARKKGYLVHVAPMDNTKIETKAFELLYLAGVLEHSREISFAVEELARISQRFYISMFKWKMISGGLDANTEKGYYSTEYNIEDIIRQISRRGIIDYIEAVTVDGKVRAWKEYRAERELYHTDRHNNNTYLSVVGTWNAA